MLKTEACFILFVCWLILCFKDTTWIDSQIILLRVCWTYLAPSPDLCITIMACDPKSPWWELSGVKVCFFSKNSCQKLRWKHVVRNSIYCHISLRKKMGQHFFFQEICEMSNCYNFLGQVSRKKPFNFPPMGPPCFPSNFPMGFRRRVEVSTS